MDDVFTAVAPTNLEQQRAWDGDEGHYWAAHADRFDRGVAAYHDRLMRTAAIEPADTVLDIGCGAGQTTLDAARQATRGRALGIDLSGPMLEVARTRAATEGITNAVFEQGDAQVQPFAGGGFDVALSRAGCMFFGDPPAAFANVARALRPRGRLILAVWQSPAENEWFTALTGALAAGRTLPPPPPDAPGPFSLANPDRVRALLTEAGFSEPDLEDLHAPMHFGASTDDAHAFVAGLLAWMVADLDEAQRQAALDALRRTLGDHTAPEGVLFGSAMWLVTARRR